MSGVYSSLLYLCIFSNMIAIRTEQTSIWRQIEARTDIFENGFYSFKIYIMMHMFMHVRMGREKKCNGIWCKI